MYQMLCQALEILRLVIHNLLPLGIYHPVGKNKHEQINILKLYRVYSWWEIGKEPGRASKREALWGLVLKDE